MERGTIFRIATLSLKCVPKFTNEERTLIKSIVAALTIKRIPDLEIMKEVYTQIHKTITRTGLFYVRKAIKKESFEWYKNMREGQYSYTNLRSELMRSYGYKGCCLF